MTERTLRGRAAVVGVAETEYYRWGKSPDPEFKLAIEAVLKVCEDAGAGVDVQFGVAHRCHWRVTSSIESATRLTAITNVAMAIEGNTDGHHWLETISL